MWKPRELGEVIAERRFTFRRSGRRPKAVRVRFGKPVQAPRAPREPWWCPLQVTGLGSKELQPIAGEDSLQALVLALKYTTRILPVEAKHAGGRIDWLGEEERPVFADTLMLEIQGIALLNLKKGLSAAVTALRADSVAPSRRALVARLDRLIETSGFQRHPALKSRR